MERLKEVKDIDAYGDLALEVFENFVDGLIGDNRFTYEPDEDEKGHFDDPGAIQWMYTSRGNFLCERMIDRLINLGVRIFDEEISINSCKFRDS